MAHGNLASYKLFARCYGGKPDNDLTNTYYENAVSDQKWINLYEMMLNPFKGKGYYVTCGSVYMGNIITAQVSHKEWKINMVIIIQLDQLGSDIELVCDAMKKRMYDTIIWQHKELDLCVAACADDAVVKTLSNFYCTIVINQGIQQQGLSKYSKRMKDPAPVDCSEQMIAYSETFHLIGKGNSVESRYIMDLGASKIHGMTHKLLLRLINMTLNNVHKIYVSLDKRHHQQYQNIGRQLKPLTMNQAVKIVCWTFL